MQEMLNKALEWATTSGLRVAITIILALVAVRLARLFANQLVRRMLTASDDPEKDKRGITLADVLRHALVLVVVAVAFMIVLKEIGLDIGPILAAAGVVGLAVGFGAKNLVEDVISGFFILMEDQVRQGDVVKIGDAAGLVERVTLRMIVLRDAAGNVHYVRNGNIGVVTNMTKEYSRYVFEIGVAYREDVDKVMEIMKQVDEELRQDTEFSAVILEPLEMLGLDQFGDSSLVIKARTKTVPIKQWAVGREFNRRLKKAFDAENIEIPFPHVTLYMGEDKEGKSPPLNVNVSGK